MLDRLKRSIAHSAMQRLPMVVQKRFSGTRAAWRNFTAPVKGTESLLPGLGISRARPISTGLNLSTRRQRPSNPQPSCVRCWNRKASHQIGKVNTYCGGGRRGSIGTLVLKLLGYNNARSYAAGFSQWSRQPDTPVEI